MGNEDPKSEDRSDEKLTPKMAYNLTEEQGYMGKVVADMYDVTPGYVSQLKSEYKSAVEEGKSSVEPSDFSTDELKTAIKDESPDENPFGSNCPVCESAIPTPDTAGQHPCPECGEVLEWSEDEI